MILREVLHAHIPTLLETSTVRDAVDKMDIYQFPALVVTTPELAVVAVVTEGDVARAVVQRGQLSQLSEEPILPFATKDPYTAGPDKEVSAPSTTCSVAASLSCPSPMKAASLAWSCA